MALAWLALQRLRTSRASLPIVVAIAIGTAFAVANAAVLAGFEAAILEDTLVHGHGDVRVWPRDRGRFEEDDIAAIRGIVPGMTATPLLGFPGAVAGAGRRFVPAPIWGVDPDASRPPFRRGPAIAEDAPDDEVDVLLGTALAARLELGVGADVELRVILGPRDELLGLPNTLAVRGKVAGLVGGTSGAYHAAFVDRARLGELAGAPGTASMIALHVGAPRDHHAATAIADRITAAVSDVDVRPWQRDESVLSSMLDTRRVVAGISYLIVIAGVTIPLWALLAIDVLRRQRELAVLAAIGFTRRAVFTMSALNAAMLSAIGCTSGAVLGSLLIAYFEAYPLIEWGTLTVHPAVTAETFAVPLAVIVSTSILASIHPAMRAARVQPAVVLRRIE